MKTLLRYLSFAGLALSLAPALLLFQGSVERETYQTCMIVGMVLWFGGALCWVKPPKPGE